MIRMATCLAVISLVPSVSRSLRWKAACSAFVGGASSFRCMDSYKLPSWGERSMVLVLVPTRAAVSAVGPGVGLGDLAKARIPCDRRGMLLAWGRGEEENTSHTSLPRLGSGHPIFFFTS